MYSKLTKEGFKVTANQGEVYCNESDGPDEETDPDIDWNLLEPVYGVKLNNPQDREEQHWSDCGWLVELIKDIADQSVSLTEKSDGRKRKLSCSPARSSKHFRRGTGDENQEVVTLEDDCQFNDDIIYVEEENSQGPKLYKNPFHEDSDDDEIKIEETITSSKKIHQIGKKHPQKRGRASEVDHFNQKIYSIIRSQVSQVKVNKKKTQPKKFLEGSGSFSCQVCEIYCNTEEMLKIHMRGKPHLKKMRKFGSQKKHSCDICYIECTDANSLILHLKGKKHLKMMAISKQTGTTATDHGSEVMILKENTVSTPTAVNEIEIIPQVEKSRDAILAGLPNCSLKDTFCWNSQDIYSFVPKNTINLDKKMYSINVAKLFCSNDMERRRQVEVREKGRTVKCDDDEEEVVVLDDDRIHTAVTRPFRGFYSAHESVVSLASVGGYYPVIKNFGYHSKPMQKEPSAARQMSTIDEGNDKKENNHKKNNEESKLSQSKREDIGLISRNLRKVNATSVVELGSSSEEDEDSTAQWVSDEDDRSTSNSEYSDDVAAHSELRYFKNGPLASLWTFDNKVGPLISPEMAGSVGEIFRRLRMDPLAREYVSVEDEDQLNVSYLVYLAENYKKSSRKPPKYRVILQNYSAPLPSPRALCHLDKMYPDSIPFLFAVVSGGTVCFFNMERVELRAYFKNI